MTKEEANQLLDNLKDGKPHPQILINRALFVSGDLSAFDLDGETTSSEGICLAQGEAIGC
jgi:hypothetical protein